MLVKELIAELEKFDPELDVELNIEGVHAPFIEGVTIFSTTSVMISGWG